MPEVMYLNGEFVAPGEAVVSVHDRGFLFGDAVYEVLRSYGGRLWALDRHLQRLQRSLAEVDMSYVSVDEAREAIVDAFRRSEFPEAHVYLQISRGAQPRAHVYTRGLAPTMLVHVRDLSGMVSPQVEAGVAAVILPDTRWRRCDIKSTNLLANVLAKTRAKEAGAHEAILVDEEGYVTEAASMALFSVTDGAVLTTPLGPHILPSVSRGLLIEVAEDAGIPVRQERVPLDVFREADEIFLASTTQAVCPVIGLDGVPVGDGNVGPVTKRLREGFRARVAAGDDAPR